MSLNPTEVNVDLNEITVAYKPADYDGEDLALAVWNGSLVIVPDSNKSLVDAVRVGSTHLTYLDLQEAGVDITEPEDDLWK